MNSSSLGNTHSPRNERKQLPSLDGSVDPMNVNIIKKIVIRK